MQTEAPLPVGVHDALSSFTIDSGLATSPMAAADGATSGISRGHIQEWLRDILIDDKARSGVRMTPRKALQYPPCYYAIQKVAGHLGMMSWRLKQRLGDRRTREATEHPSYRLLLEPNELQGRSVFVEAVTAAAIFRGNGRAYIERDSYMRPRSLTILLPERTQTVLVNGEKWHITEIVVDSETGRTEKYKLPDRDVLHIMNFSYDGIAGIDVYQLAKDSIGLGVAAEQQQANHFGRNAIPGLLLQAPKNTFRKPGEANKFLSDFREMHEGIDNAGKTALVQHGITATALSHTGRNSQTIESRQFQREEVALWWALESMIGTKGQSYNSEEQRQLAYLKGLPGRLRNRWEEESDRKLLTEREKRTGSHFHQLNPGSLLQADMKTTIDTLQNGISATIWSPNDAREILGEDAREGGDEYGNPNTSSGASGDDDTGDGSAETADAAALRQRLTSAYESRLLDLWQVEAKRVRTAAAKGDADKFREWVDRFYDSADWPKTLGRVWQDFGGESAEVHRVTVSHAGELTEASLGDDWQEAVEAVVEQWHDQPAKLAHDLVNPTVGDSP